MCFKKILNEILKVNNVLLKINTKEEEDEEATGHTGKKGLGVHVPPCAMLMTISLSYS